MSENSRPFELKMFVKNISFRMQNPTRLKLQPGWNINDGENIFINWLFQSMKPLLAIRIKSYNPPQLLTYVGQVHQKLYQILTQIKTSIAISVHKHSIYSRTTTKTVEQNADQNFSDLHITFDSWYVHRCRWPTTHWWKASKSVVLANPVTSSLWS